MGSDSLGDIIVIASYNVNLGNQCSNLTCNFFTRAEELAEEEKKKEGTAMAPGTTVLLVAVRESSREAFIQVGRNNMIRPM